MRESKDAMVPEFEHAGIPTVSVVIPSFNSAVCVRDAVDSALAQTHRVLEVIVVDDGSTDDTAELIERHLDDRVRCIRRENGGPAAARNTGIQAARGEWIAFLDADDTWMPEKIDEQLCAAHIEQADAVFCGNISYTAGQGERFVCYHGDMSRLTLLPQLLCRNVLDGGGSTALIRRSVFDRTGMFDPEMNASEDRDLFIRIADAFRVSYVPKALARIEVGPIRFGSNIERNLRNAGIILDRHAFRLQGLPNAATQLRHARAAMLERAGMQFLYEGLYGRAFGLLIRSLCYRPFSANPWKAMINVCTGRRRYGPQAVATTALATTEVSA